MTSTARMHWRPGAPFSYPLPSQGPTMRRFLFDVAAACGLSYTRVGDNWTWSFQKVTCRHCIRIRGIGRFDTDETKRTVLARGSDGETTWESAVEKP